jgi:hypothetical protein
MKKVIGFSVWGDNPKYTIGAIKNAKLAKELFPDWICYFYIGKSTPTNIVDELKSFDNTHIIEMGENGNWEGMFWRFLPIDDEDVDVLISRDTDSRLSMREKLAIDEWLSTKQKFHIMRDHPSHGVPILGGMWGARKGAITNIKKLIEEYTKGDYWQVDQNFLRDVIYPIIRYNSITHDDIFKFEGTSFDFPSERIDYEFIGQVYDENDNETIEYKESLKRFLNENFNNTGKG